MNSVPVRTVVAVLARLEHGFSDFATSFTTGDSVLWLGLWHHARRGSQRFRSCSSVYLKCSGPKSTTPTPSVLTG